MRVLCLTVIAIAALTGGCAHQTDEAIGPESPVASTSAQMQPGPPGRGDPPTLPARYRNTNVHFGTVSTADALRLCPQDGHLKLVCLADALKARLTPEQIAMIQLPYTLEDARKWSNFPPLGYRDRLGITLGELDETQLGFVKAMLVEASGMAADEGYDELEQILNADDFLLAETGELGFSSSNFHIAFLGVPSANGKWELQFGGHHTAFANTYSDGRLIGATPSFRGVEPFVSFEMNGRSNDPMSQERGAFATLLGTLSPAQLDQARLSQTFTDVVVGPQKDDNFPDEREGVPGSGLTAPQRTALLAAMAPYVHDVDARNADEIMRRYEAEIDATFVAFSGNPAVTDVNDYVRIDGPSIWIEFSMQPGRSIPGVHPHSVWRDRRADYGGGRE